MYNFDKTGIYAIINKINGKIYIGSTTVSFKSRWDGHKKDLKNNSHINLHLQSAYNKYDKKAFKFKIIQFVDKEDFDWILDIETSWIRYYDSTNKIKGYNICKIAGSTKGIKLREETKIKMADKKIGTSKISLEEAIQIKIMLLEKVNDSSIANKCDRISKKFNTCGSSIHRIYYGKHNLSKDLGGSYFDWTNKEKKEITIDIALNIKKMLLLKIKQSIIQKELCISKGTIEKIKHGRHIFSTQLGGSYYQWMEELE